MAAAGVGSMLLQPDTYYNFRALTLGSLADMRHFGVCVSSRWQRSLCWSDADRVEYITAVLRNVPTPVIFLARLSDEARSHMPLGMAAAEQCIVDGQNRLAAMADFVHNPHSQIRVRACDVFADVPHMTNTVKFVDLSETMKLRVRNVQIMVCEFTAHTDDGYLRECFRAINKSHRLTTAERIHSYEQVPLVSMVLQPLEAAWRAEIKQLRPRWRTKKHSLLMLIARIAALTDTRQQSVHLSSPRAIEEWVAVSEGVMYTPMDRAAINNLVHAVVNVYRDRGCDHNMHIFVDTVWAVHAHDFVPWQSARDEAVLVDLVDHITRLRAASTAHWGNTASTQIDARMRRKDIVEYLARAHECTLRHGAHLLLVCDDATNAFSVRPEVEDTPADNVDDNAPTDNGLGLWLDAQQQRRQRPRIDDDTDDDEDSTTTDEE